MSISVFKKTVQSKGKTVKKWYYSYYDQDGNRKQKVCKGCKTVAEAEAYVKQIEDSLNKVTISSIAEDMFQEGSEHLSRMQALGKKFSYKTLLCYRSFIKIIIQDFGERYFDELTSKDVFNHLVTLNKSGSWKNNYCEILSKIYDEALWQTGHEFNKPTFHRFARNSKKADIFTTEELSKFFNEIYWDNKDIYLLFLLTASCGLRLGEARAIQLRQILFEQHALVIDGFCLADGTRTNYNKKGSDEDTKMRVAVIPDFVLSKLQKYISRHNFKPCDYIFYRNDNEPLRQEHLEAVFERQLKICGIHKNSRRLVPHSLRFTYVTRMRRNLDGETVQKLVGHSSIEMTDYYTRISINDMAMSLQGALPAANKLFE